MNLRMFLAGQDRVLGAALGISLAFHALLLAVHFQLPDTLRWKPTAQPLEVVLVNTKTRERPSRAELLAQANLDRGGNVDERRRARTPLPVTEPKNPGKDLAAAQRRARELEVRQQQVLTQPHPSQARVPNAERQAPSDEPGGQTSGRDLADLALAAMRLQAQIDKRIDEYQKRPRKQFIGANAAEYRFAQYEEDWRVKVERVGTLNYPAEARGKLYGNLRMTVTIRPDGTVESIELDRSSGLKVLDAAAFKIVRMATPFASFPPNIRRDTDLLVITRTWFFGQGDKIWTE
ncbi:MAG: periplasmic protein TonB [Betaproteobacteria bacterium]|nr:periplasmic protein TonB [Betaproteobacteria bacterium]